MQVCPPPKAVIRSPDLILPEGACDTVCHVIGPRSRFPFSDSRKYDVPDSPYEALCALHDQLGIHRAVLVQASVHGPDNRAMMDALERSSGRYLGVAILDEDITDAELEQMDQAGIRGVRYNFVRMLGGPPDLKRYEQMLYRIRPFGWHVALHVGPAELAEYAALFARSPVPLVIEHLGRTEIGRGLKDSAFQRLLSMLTDDNIWIKIDMGDRLSIEGPPYHDVVPFVHRLIAAAPDRIVWGTDWPHPMYAPDREMPDDGDLVDLLDIYAPDPEMRQRILVENPERLYRFGASYR